MRSSQLIHSLVRTGLFLSVLGFGIIVLLVETIPAFAWAYSLPQYLLLILVVFGIIEVRLEAHDTASRERERQRVWPYIVLGTLAISGIMYWITAPWDMLWRIGLAVYAAAALITLLLIVLEE